MAKKLPSKKTVKNKCDKLWREIIYRRDCDTCQKCGKPVSGNDRQASHVIPRTYGWLRWDVENGKVLCYRCHVEWHENPLESAKWFEEKFPERWKYLLVQKRALTGTIPISWLREKLVELEKELACLTS